MNPTIAMDLARKLELKLMIYLRKYFYQKKKKEDDFEA